MEKKSRSLRNTAVKDLTPRDAKGVKGGMLSNLANMRHEMLKGVANNLRS